MIKAALKPKVGQPSAPVSIQPTMPLHSIPHHEEPAPTPLQSETQSRELLNAVRHALQRRKSLHDNLVEAAIRINKSPNSKLTLLVLPQGNGRPPVRPHISVSRETVSALLSYTADSSSLSVDSATVLADVHERLGKYFDRVARMPVKLA